MITNATADGTLYTKNWEIEPLFPMPDAVGVNKEYDLYPLAFLGLCVFTCQSSIIVCTSPVPLAFGDS